MAILWDFRWRLLEGLWMTAQVSALAILLALGVAFLCGFGLVSRSAWLRGPVTLFVEFARGTPLLAQLFWVYFVLPGFGLMLDPYVAGVLVLGLCNGAYGAQIVTGALSSVTTAQREAGVALNFTRAQIMRYVVLPQASVVMLPLFSNLAIEIVKGSALISLIGLADLSFQAKSIMLIHVNTPAVLLVVLLAYFALALILSAAFRALEARLCGAWTGRR